MSKAKVDAAVAKHGYELTDEPELGRLIVDAPAGRVFSCRFTHCVVAWYDADRGEPKADAWASLAEDLAAGTEACDTAVGECDTCDVCPC